MNCGCIATGEIECDGCQRIIQHGEQYLVMEETEGEKSRFCIDCCLSKGYAICIREKGEQRYTFFPPQLNP